MRKWRGVGGGRAGRSYLSLPLNSPRLKNYRVTIYKKPIKIESANTEGHLMIQ